MIEAHRKRFGRKHKLTANALWVHSNILGLCQDAQAEEKVLKEALDIYEAGNYRPSRMHYYIALDIAENKIRQAKSLDEAERSALRAQEIAAGLSFRKHYHRTLAQLTLARVRMVKAEFTPDVESLLLRCRDTSREQLDGVEQTRLLRDVYRELNRFYRQVHSPSKAAEAARDLRALQPSDREALYEAACGLALSMPEVGQGKSTLSQAEEAERSSYGDQAVAALRQAIANGFRDSERLLNDRALDTLREREDFKKLVIELASLQKR
jgi:hypothetical protein